jgi:hypothetical protein
MQHNAYTDLALIQSTRRAGQREEFWLTHPATSSEWREILGFSSNDWWTTSGRAKCQHSARSLIRVNYCDARDLVRKDIRALRSTLCRDRRVFMGGTSSARIPAHERRQDFCRGSKRSAWPTLSSWPWRLYDLRHLSFAICQQVDHRVTTSCVRGGFLAHC